MFVYSIVTLTRIITYRPQYDITLLSLVTLSLDPVLRALTMLDRDRRILQQADSALWDEALTSPTVTGEAGSLPCHP